MEKLRNSVVLCGKIYDNRFPCGLQRNLIIDMGRKAPCGKCGRENEKTNYIEKFSGGAKLVCQQLTSS
jgi:hypothetical protein